EKSCPNADSIFDLNPVSSDPPGPNWELIFCAPSAAASLLSFAAGVFPGGDPDRVVTTAACGPESAVATGVVEINASIDASPPPPLIRDASSSGRPVMRLVAAQTEAACRTRRAITGMYSFADRTPLDSGA